MSALLERARSRAAFELERGLRKLSSRALWRAMSSRHPLCGPPRAELESRLRAAVEVEAEPAKVALLPGLDIRSGVVFFHGQRMGAATTDQERAFACARSGERDPAFGDLVALGYAFECKALPAPADRPWNLVLAPHCDDAPLAMGGLVATRGATDNTLIVNVFSTSGWVGKGIRRKSIEETTRIRDAEDALSSRIVGARSMGLGLWEVDIHYYARRAIHGYPERPDFRFEYDPALRTPGELDSIRVAIRMLTRRLKPARIFMPMGAGAHADHLTLAAVCAECLPWVAAEAPESELLLYEDQPYSTYKGVDNAALAASFSPRHRASPELVDITDAFEQRVQSIAAHRSQFARDENEERLDGYAAHLGQLAGKAPRRMVRVWRLTDAG